MYNHINKQKHSSHANNKYNKQTQDELTNRLIYMDNPKR